MRGGEAWRMAATSLWNRKLRSLLTILGVVIGVGSVIAVVSLGAAFEESITSQFDDIDDRSIFVTASQEDVAQGPPDAGQFGLVFTEVDRQNLLALQGVERVVASGEVVVTGLGAGTLERPFRTLSATTADADEVRHREGYLSGGPFSDGEEHIVLGYSVAQALSGVSGSREPTLQAGDNVTIRYPDGTHQNVTISGVLAKEDSLFGSLNAQAFVPIDPFYTTALRSPSTGDVVRVFNGFTVVAERGSNVNGVRDEVRAYMDDASDAQALLEDLEGLVILVATASDITDQISGAFDQVTIFIAAIAATSLAVGGIMIGTIMLISVTERTREIGVMKAIGGTERNILWLFLLEAGLIGLIGSIVGLALGLGGGYALVEGLFGSEDVSFLVPWDWVAISMLFGIATGIIAGWLPARRATKVNPVEALSYE